MRAENTVKKTGLREKSQLMSASEIDRTLVRVAHEIVEKNDGAVDLGLVGVRRRGVPLAERLGKLISRIEGTNIVLVDDVLFTGRTIRAALDALFSHGRPRRVQLCVLIDRGHRELPIEAAFVGRNVQTTMNEVIEVKLTEIDGAEKVLLMEK